MMSYSLKDKVVLVTAGSRGLGASIAARFAAEGSHISINYVSNKSAADYLANKLGKQYSVKCCVIQGDAASTEDNARLVKGTVENLGGLDIIIANAGWTKQSKPGDLHALSHEDWNRCWAVNVMSHLTLMQTAAPKFNENPEGGVYLITSSIAGISTMGSSMRYSVTKAAGLQLMKLLSGSLGPKIRINAVLPGLLLTEWGLGFSPEVIAYLKGRSILKHETYLDDCAKTFTDLAQNTSITGQSIVIDSGLMQGPVLGG